MGQLIGLAILVLVVYAVLSRLLSKRTKVQQLEHLPVLQNDFYQKQYEHLTEILAQKEKQLNQIHMDYQEKMEVAYQRGFQDGAKLKHMARQNN